MAIFMAIFIFKQAQRSIRQTSTALRDLKKKRGETSGLRHILFLLHENPPGDRRDIRKSLIIHQRVKKYFTNAG